MERSHYNDKDTEFLGRSTIFFPRVDRYTDMHAFTRVPICVSDKIVFKDEDEALRMNCIDGPEMKWMTCNDRHGFLYGSKATVSEMNKSQE